jgi:hypothetical protein
MRKLPDRFLGPEVHRRNRSTPPELVEKKPPSPAVSTDRRRFEVS